MVKKLSFGQKWARSLSKKELNGVLKSKILKGFSKRLKQIFLLEKRLVRNELKRRKERGK